MPSTNSLIQQLSASYPQFRFRESEQFLWSPHEKTVYYNTKDDYAFLLHELSHGLLGHAEYNRDIELITMERSAWDCATKLARNYGLVIDENMLENTLDSYRDWLHSRSTCPRCNATGMQTKKKTYRCLACHHDWRVNEARICALRRFPV